MNDASPIFCDYDIGSALQSLAVRQPTAPAIYAPGRLTLNYADLIAQIRYVRARLAGWNIARGDIVAGIVPLRAEMALACATMPAAATFAPLDSDLTEEGYAEMYRCLRPKALACALAPSHPARAAAARLGIAELDLAAHWERAAGTYTLALACARESLGNDAVVPTGTAYVLHGRRTTGPLKLVPVADRRLIRYSRTLWRWLGRSSSEVGRIFKPLHRASGLFTQLMAPLLHGASVICLPEADTARRDDNVDRVGNLIPPAETGTASETAAAG